MKRSGPPSRRPYRPPLHDMRRAWAERNPGYRMPQRSAKRARVLAEVRPDVREAVWERAGGRCEYAAVIPELPCASPWPHRPPLEVDEIHGGSRRGEEMQDPDACVLTCQAHHDLKTDGATIDGVWIGKREVLARWALRSPT